MTHCGKFRTGPITRRDMLARGAAGFAGAILPTLLSEDTFARSIKGITGSDGLGLKHHSAKARSVIFLYMDGGPGQMDTFDPKPELKKWAGQPFPGERSATQFEDVGGVLPSPWSFKQYGECGHTISSLFPHLTTQADELCMVRSMTSPFTEHTNANYFLHTGHGLAGRPSMGSWMSYGLGNENENLPAFVVLNGGLTPPGGLDCFGSGFLPPEHQAQRMVPRGNGLPNIQPRETPDHQRRKLDALRALDALHATEMDNPQVDAAIKNWELAFRMQAEVPDLMELANEPEWLTEKYGFNHQYEPTRIYAAECMLARRMVERGVRFVELTCPLVDGDRWDQHSNLKAGHDNNARAVDQPIAALLEDLKVRGLLDETLVVFAGEFGRTPFAQGNNGRDHNPHGFTIWMAGGGTKPGMVYGATDDFGYHAIENPLEIHDLHATMMHLLGVHHESLTINHGGREMRLTDVHGRVVRDLCLS